MALGTRTMKTEHAGAKNGGGFWGTRAEAKQASRRRRRAMERRICLSGKRMVVEAADENHLLA